MVQRVNGSGFEINVCDIAEAPQRDARIYQHLRDTVIGAHCENGAMDHPCAGRITITAKHVLLQCQLCGDTKLTMDTAEGRP